MRYLALAVDYDGTIAHDGHVDIATRLALERVKQSGRKLLLVTGRELDELKTICDCLGLFDAVVAENGAVLFDPNAAEVQLLADPPPPELVARLRSRQVPVSAGRVIVATWVPHEHHVLSIIHELGLIWHVIFNKNAVMALPEGVTKSSGLLAALPRLALRAEQVVAVGDAENDTALLRVCGIGAAVSNAIDALKRQADLVLDGERGAGVQELVEHLLDNDLADVTRQDRPAGPVPEAQELP